MRPTPQHPHVRDAEAPERPEEVTLHLTPALVARLESKALGDFLGVESWRRPIVAELLIEMALAGLEKVLARRPERVADVEAARSLSGTRDTSSDAT